MLQNSSHLLTPIDPDLALSTAVIVEVESKRFRLKLPELSQSKFLCVKILTKDL
jgi:hypothetical protein